MTPVVRSLLALAALGTSFPVCENRRLSEGPWASPHLGTGHRRHREGSGQLQEAGGRPVAPGWFAFACRVLLPHCFLSLFWSPTPPPERLSKGTPLVFPFRRFLPSPAQGAGDPCVMSKAPATWLLLCTYTLYFVICSNNYNLFFGTCNLEFYALTKTTQQKFSHSPHI